MKTSFLINALSTPLMLGVYEEGVLVEELSSSKKASEVLVELLAKLLQKYEPCELIYANGPGSYMGIKLSYTILQTISIVKGIPLYSVSAFLLNDNKPIQANKKLCFVKSGDEISIQEALPGDFFMPKLLCAYSSENAPFYFLPAL